MNTFFRWLAFGVKVIVSLFLLWFAFEMIVVGPDYLNRIVGAFLFLFIIAFNLFSLFLKKRLLIRFPKLKLLWRIVLALYLLCIVFVVVEVSLAFQRMDDRVKTQEAVNIINGTRIDLDDVMGKNLPPKPDQTVNDSTIAGIDANNNTIRDDVELAIFEKYPNSAKIRAAELQYTKELQNELVNIFNSDTWVAVAKNENNGIACLVELAFDSYKDISSRIDKSNEWQKEVEDLVFNTNVRINKRKEIKKYETSYVVGDGKCDVDLSLL